MYCSFPLLQQRDLRRKSVMEKEKCVWDNNRSMCKHQCIYSNHLNSSILRENMSGDRNDKKYSMDRRCR